MKIVFMLLVCSIVFPACKKTTEPYIPKSVDEYPLSPEDAWKYTTILSTTKFRPVVSGFILSDTIYHWTSTVKNIGEMILKDSVNTFALEDKEIFGPGDTSVSRNYYVTKNDTLFLFAYEGNQPYALPKQGQVKFHSGGQIFGSLHDMARFFERQLPTMQLFSGNTIYYEVKLPKVIIFPLKIGFEWIFRERGFPLYKMGKKIIGRETVQTPKGGLEAYNIQLFWDLNFDGTLDTLIAAHDYIGTNGLLKRTYLDKNAEVLFTDGTLAGLIELRIESDISSFAIHKNSIQYY